MDCKRVEEGVVVLGDKKKALLSFLVRDVDIEPRNQAYGGKIYSRQYLSFPHTHTHTTFWFFTYLANRDIPFTCIDFASRISE